MFRRLRRAARARSFHLPPGLADRGLDAVEDLSAQLMRLEHARLELQHARVEGREDRPDAVLVERLHHVHGALRMVEFQAHDRAVLADADEEIAVERLDLLQSMSQE